MKTYTHKELNIARLDKEDVAEYIVDMCNSDAIQFLENDPSYLSTDYICSALLTRYNNRDVPGSVKMYRYLKRRDFSEVQSRHPEFVAFVMNVYVPWAKAMSRA